MEDWTDEDRGRVLAAARAACEAVGIEADGVYVVGSCCFNVYGPRDVDVLVVSSRDGSSEEASAAARAIVPNIDLKIKRDLNDQTCDLGFKVPYYDVVTGTLHHKDPYAVVPFTFQWQEGRGVYVTMLRDKITSVSRMIGLT